MLILSTGLTETPAGQRRRYYSLRCKCGAEFQTAEHVITRARQGKAVLRCEDCRYLAKLSESKAGYEKRKSGNDLQRPEVKPKKKEHGQTRVLNGGRPLITPEAVRILNNNKTAPYYRRALKILVEYVDACIDARIMPDWNRGVIEAIEKAEGEHRTGTSANADRWTPQTIGMGLCTVHYGQYVAPIDSSPHGS